MSDECFVPRSRPKYGVTVRTESPRPTRTDHGELVVYTQVWMGHWTMERAIRLTDPFQGHVHVPLWAIALAPSSWLPDRDPCHRR